MAYPQETFTQTKLLPGSLIQLRREAVAENTLFYQLDVLKKTGRYDCFNLKWQDVYSREPEVWPIPDHLFWDSDVAKWIEGACYLLHDHPNPKLDGAIDELVGMIRHAQQPDGYLNLHYTVVAPGKRFTNLRDMHELYNAGHMIEAALAHHALYKNDRLMEPILKYVDLLCQTFGSGENQIHGYPGHPEIELALLRLYQRTQNPKHLELARYFVTERGNPTGMHDEHYFRWELKNRGDDPNKRPGYHTELGGCLWYYQAHLPLVEQPTVEGHSVRAMYLLTAAADLARMDSFSKDAVSRLWHNMTNRKMYVTGGIGSMKQYEGFGVDYFLPQGTDEGGCYAETCAAIGVMMLAQRILQYDLNGKYGDIMELCLYNAVLTAMSADGTSFTYVNQLASSNADPCQRCDWFTVACCPPNILRLLGQISGYIYTQHDSVVDVHLYIPSEMEFNGGTLKQESNYPWDGNIKFTMQGDATGIRLRIPQFAASEWQLDPPANDAQLRQGYLHLSLSYIRAHKTFTLLLPVRPRLIACHPYAGNTLSVARGPLVYCVEDTDNSSVQDHFKGTVLQNSCLEDHQEYEVADGVIGLKLVNGIWTVKQQQLENEMANMPFTDAASMASVFEPTQELNFVPFYFRANRNGRGQSRVGLQRRF